LGLLGLGIFAWVSCDTANETAQVPDRSIISMTRLIADPHAHDGRRVGVYGVFAKYGFEYYLFPSTETFHYRMEGDMFMIGMNRDDRERLNLDADLVNLAHGKYIFLEGVFVATSADEVHPTDGSFYDISQFTVIYDTEGSKEPELPHDY